MDSSSLPSIIELQQQFPFKSLPYTKKVFISTNFRRFR